MWDERIKLDEIRRHFKWTDLEECGNFERWLVFFLENKQHDVEETIAKLDRRMDMEMNELWTYEILPSMRENLASGALREIGEALDGSTTLYCVTRRDFPTSANRDDRKKNFDILMTYATRLRPSSKNSGTFTMLVNQHKAGVWANTDLSYISTVAVRMSKFWPGALLRIIVVKMSGALTTVLKPLIKALPQHIKSKIVILSEKEVEEGKLLEYFTPEMLPVELGGLNESDIENCWKDFADKVYDYFDDGVLGMKTAMLSRPSSKFSIFPHECRQWMTSLSEAPLSPKGRSLLAASTTMINAAMMMSPMPGFDEFSDCISVNMTDVEVSINPCFSEFEVEETYFRGVLMEFEADRWKDIIDLCRATRELCVSRVQNEVAPDRIMSKCPEAPKAVGRVALWVCCLLIAAYFTVATVFILLFILSLMTVCFLGLFNTTQQTLSCMFGVLVLGHQGALIASRGIECIQGAFRGQSVINLRVSNTQYGCYAQTAIWAVMLVISCVIFFLYVNSDYILDTGIKISFAWGWMGCSVALCLFHTLYPTPLIDTTALNRQNVSSKQHALEEETSIGLMTIYLIFNVSEGFECMERDDARELKYHVLGLVFFGSATVSLGIAHVLANHNLFIIFSGICALWTALFANYVLASAKAMRQNPTKHLWLTFIWLVTAMWMYFIAVIGLYGPVPSQNTTLTTFAVLIFAFMILLLLLRLTRQKRCMRVPLLRTAYVYLSFLVVGAVANAFTVHWSFGVLLAVLFIHCTLCYVMRKGTKHFGIAVLTVGFIVLQVVTLLMGQSLTVKEHSAPLSITAYAPIGADSYPMCDRRYGPERLSLVDFSLFCTLAHARTSSAALSVDLDRWFPTFRLVEEVDFSGNAGIRIFQSTMSNTTVFTVRGSTDVSFSIQTTSMWTETLAYTPLSYILPTNWTTELVQTTSFLGRFLKFPSLHDDVYEWVRVTIRKRGIDIDNAFMTGYGYGGWLAQVAGAKLGISTYVFSSPGLEYVLMKIGLERYRAVRTVVNVVPTNSPIPTADTRSGVIQPITCVGTVSDTSCSSLESVSCELLRSCGSTGNRSLAC
eukprot:PhF_6_TR36503/c0_g1_i1/m.53700